jgi:hypothetical protein
MYLIYVRSVGIVDATQYQEDAMFIYFLLKQHSADAYIQYNRKFLSNIVKL